MGSASCSRIVDRSGSHQANRAYYDAFSQRYEQHRGRNDPGGYHELLDELEAEYVARFGTGREVLEVGCGTGLVLQRIEAFASRVRGVDLSPGMLEKARARGLDVVEGSATALPFEDASFDVSCSFKVLAHVRDVDLALREMARVVRPGGHVLAELYNPISWRGLAKRVAPAGRVAKNAKESDVFTRFDPPRRARQLTPPGCTFVGARGIRILTPTAHLMRIPLVREALRHGERWLCDTPLKAFAGFYVAAYQKD
jgi:ubiquinone/menaquinone biosynthesis C-methylase UbiE